MKLIMDAVRNEEALKGVVDNLNDVLLTQCAEARPASFIFLLREFSCGYALLKPQLMLLTLMDGRFTRFSAVT